MHIVSLLNAPGTSDLGHSAADPIESRSDYTLSGAVQTAAVLQPAPSHNSIFREPDGRLNRPLIGVLTVAGLLSFGHLVCPASSGMRVWFDGIARITQVIPSQESPR